MRRLDNRLLGQKNARHEGGQLESFLIMEDVYASAAARNNNSVSRGRRRRFPEAQLHAAVVVHLRLRAKPDVLWLHVPNGERRDKIAGAKLKRMGVLAGASDLLLWHRGYSFALELKGDGGRLSDAQLEFLARFNDAGGHSAVAENIDRALACMEAWGLLSGRSQ